MTGKVTLLVGIGIYVIGLGLAFVGACGAGTEQQPITDNVRVQRTLLADAFLGLGRYPSG